MNDMEKFEKIFLAMFVAVGVLGVGTLAFIVWLVVTLLSHFGVV